MGQAIRPTIQGFVIYPFVFAMSATFLDVPWLAL